MPTSAFTFFEDWLEYSQESANLQTDTVSYALVNNASGVSASLDAVLADITEIAYTNLTDNGPGSRGVTIASSQTGGTYSAVATDITLTASGGAVAPFRYVVLFDNTLVGDPLIGYMDATGAASDLTLNDGDSLAINFGATLYTIS